MTVDTRVECSLARMVKLLDGFAQEKVCGRCLPCPLGVGQALAILGRLTRGQGQEKDLERLAGIAAGLAATARCRRGREMATALSDSLLDTEGYVAHVAGRCPAGACRKLLRFQVVPEWCTMCDRCRKICPRGAILGDPYIPYRSDNRPYVILEKKCDGCGLCQPACPVEAIEVV